MLQYRPNAPKRRVLLICSNWAPGHACIGASSRANRGNCSASLSFEEMNSQLSCGRPFKRDMVAVARASGTQECSRLTFLPPNHIDDLIHRVQRQNKGVQEFACEASVTALVQTFDFRHNRAIPRIQMFHDQRIATSDTLSR